MSVRTPLLASAGVSGIIAARRAPAIVHMSAYANTLTAIIGDIYTALDVVSREQVGFIPSVMRAPGAERAAVGQSVPYPIAPAQTARDIVASMQVPNPPDNNFQTGFITISKAREVAFGFTGEEQQGLNSGIATGAPGYLGAQAMLVAQALRTLTNEVENDLASTAALGASRAYGTGGTIPFGSGDLTDLAQIKKILNDNGAPATGRSLVMNSAASAKMITIGNLSKVNEAGDNMTLRDGELTNVYGFSCKETGQQVDFVKGTAAGATTNNAGYAKGARVISLAAAGTGAVKAGDFITFAGDTNKYAVEIGDADVSNGGTVTLRAPGLRVAIPAANTAITVGNSYAANVGFSSDALHLVTRQPALPQEGDLAIDRMAITDPRSGLTFEFAIYPGHRMISGMIGIAWGQVANKSEHIAMLLG